MIALYLRLSVSDGDLGQDEKDESNSIENQRALLYDFVERRDDVTGEIIEYVDDGYSGTNFNRPGFQQMLEDMKAGKISVLLTKDLSRLGRNYIEVGDYMEQIFPMLGVRYIAVTSNYDSIDHPGSTMGLEMSMMNLLNSMYSKDLSKKVKTGLKARWKSGKATAAQAPLGYVRDKEDKSKWIIEPIAAEIVRHIFELALDGHTILGITEILNKEGVMTPGQYREKYGFMKRVNRKVKDEEWLWNDTRVRNILKDYSYTGALVAGKATTIIVGSNTSRKVPESDRVFFEGHHEPIVSKEEYEKARSIIIKQKHGGFVNHDDYALGKVMYCGNCGLKMAVSKTLDRHFTCAHKARTGKASKCCDARYPAEKVEYVVKRSLRWQLLCLERLDKDLRTVSEQLPDHSETIEGMEKEIQRLKIEKTEIYEAYANRFITKDVYLSRRDAIKEKMERVQKQQDVLKGPRERIGTLKKEADRYMDLANKLYSISELNEEMVGAFIERINLYDEDHIEIIYKFTDLMRSIVIELEEEEETA